MKVACSENIEHLSIVPAEASADDPTVINKLEEPTTEKSASSSSSNNNDANKVRAYEKMSV